MLCSFSSARNEVKFDEKITILFVYIFACFSRTSPRILPQKCTDESDKEKVFFFFICCFVLEKYKSYHCRTFHMNFGNATAKMKKVYSHARYDKISLFSSKVVYQGLTLVVGIEWRTKLQRSTCRRRKFYKAAMIPYARFFKINLNAHKIHWMSRQLNSNMFILRYIRFENESSVARQVTIDIFF